MMHGGIFTLFGCFYFIYYYSWFIILHYYMCSSTRGDGGEIALRANPSNGTVEVVGQF
jgi:hypothetical protein